MTDLIYWDDFGDVFKDKIGDDDNLIDVSILKTWQSVYEID